MPNPQTLSPKCLNYLASKRLLKHPLGRSPNHNSSPNPTNKSNLFCQALKKGAGPSPPKESFIAPTEHVTTNCFPEP